MRIRPVELEDVGALARLYVAVFEREPWNEAWEVSWAEDRLGMICRSPGYRGFLAEGPEGALGAVLGRSLPFQGRDEFELVEFFVAPGCQGIGIGSRLLSHLEGVLRGEGFASVVLITGRGIGAEAFYRKRGYRVSEGMVLMARRLSPGDAPASGPG